MSRLLGFSSLIIVALSFTNGCQSKSVQNAVSKKNSVAAGPSADAATQAHVTPVSEARDVDGKAYSLDGQSVTARAIITTGESRRPVFIEQNNLAFASRRGSLERWQVFEADLAKGVERRISFDAGDAEPVTAFGHRLAIASSSDERKSGTRVLNEYLDKAGAKAAADASQASSPSALQHLMLEHPANGRKGTEWVRISREPSRQWIVSVDRDMKNAVAILQGDATLIYRIAIGTKAREPETRAWYPLKIEGKVTDGHIFPDGSRIAWSNGSNLWTTDLKGADSKPIGDAAVPAVNSFTIDPSGQWIVFSTPTSSRGLNLMALHKSGRCLKYLTELPGDETDPAFAPDGQTLFFSLKQGDTHSIAKIPFGTPAQITAACP